MDFNPGTGGTITATTLENQWFTLLNLVQQYEQDQTINPEQRANILSSTLDQDTYILSGTATIYCSISYVAQGEMVDYPDPYVGATFTEGSSGDGNATNIVQALVERTRMLIKAERDQTYNPLAIALKFTGISWTILDAPVSTPVTHNATLEFSFENFAVESMNTGDGTTLKAKTWLSGSADQL